MKKMFSIILLLFMASACSETETQMPMETEKEKMPVTWEEVDGYVVEKIKEGGKERILLVEGISQQEAVEKTFQDISSNGSYENAIWLMDEEIDFPDIQKGGALTAWWDTAKPHQEPGILTVPAEKLEMNQVFKEGQTQGDQEKLTETIGYVQHKSAEAAWIVSQLNATTHGITFDITAIEEKTVSKLEEGQKVVVTHYSELLFSNPAQGMAVDLTILEESAKE